MQLALSDSGNDYEKTHKVRVNYRSIGSGAGLSELKQGFEHPSSSMAAGQGTLPGSFSGLNQLGEITGLYYDASNTFHGYVRSSNGKFTDFEVTGADVTTPYDGTFPNSLNHFGIVTGDYIDGNDAKGATYGFVRCP